MKALLTVLLLFVVFTAPAQTKHRKRVAHFLPDSATAVRIGEKILLARYGDRIYESKPITAKLENGIWLVSGYLPEGFFGGVPFVELRKRDGKILQMGFPK